MKNILTKIKECGKGCKAKVFFEYKGDNQVVEGVVKSISQQKKQITIETDEDDWEIDFKDIVDIEKISNNIRTFVIDGNTVYTIPATKEIVSDTNRQKAKLTFKEKLLVGVLIVFLGNILMDLIEGPSPYTVCENEVKRMPGYVRIFDHNSYVNKYTQEIVHIEFEVGFENNNGGYYTRWLHCAPKKEKGKWVATFPGL